jgi:hypothetical protein
MEVGGAAPGASPAHSRRAQYVLLTLLVIAAIVALVVLLAGALMPSTSAPADVSNGWGGVTPIHDDAWNVR